MTMRSVTVFGGTGYLGRRIVQRLARAGWRVRVAARRPDAAAGEDAEVAAVDITDAEAVARAVRGAEAVVNAVALYAERDGYTFDAVHVAGAEDLARAARAAGVQRLVHVSGIGADPASTSRYVAARGRGEAAVRAVFPAAVILRPSVLFGPDDAFVSTLRTLTRLPLVPLFGRGDTLLQPVHVDDVAAAAARLVEADGAPAHLFELGGAEVLAYRQIVERVLASCGRRRPLLPVPFTIWHALARLAQVLPRAPLTSDQVTLMQHDNIVGTGHAGFAALDIEPRALSSYLQGL